MGSAESRLHEDLTSNSEVERLFPIDPQLKKNNPKREVMEVQETPDRNKMGTTTKQYNDQGTRNNIEQKKNRRTRYYRAKLQIQRTATY